MSSYRRPCRECGQRISLRQMPAGQWVAFDVSTEEPHICGIENEPDVSVKIKGKKKKNFEEDDSIDLGYDSSDLEVEEDDDLEEILDENKVYNNSSGVSYCIDKAIKDKKRILIDYYSDFNNESTYREISPIKKFKLKSRNYLQAYCHLRKAERNFLTKSIKTATEMDKKRTSVRLSKPNVNFILNEDEELDDIKLTKRKVEKKEKVKEKRKIKKEIRVKRQNFSNANTASTFQNFAGKVEDFFEQLFSLGIALGMLGLLIFIFYMAIFD